MTGEPKRRSREEQQLKERAQKFYKDQSRNLIKELREQKGMTYADLRRRLQAHGVEIDLQVLVNKIGRGTYSFTFAMQVLAAMDVTTLPIPNALGADRANPAHGGGWDSTVTARKAQPLVQTAEEPDDPDHPG